MTKAKLTRIPKRVLACVLAVLMVLSCLTMLPFTGFAANENHAKLESPAVVQGDNGTYYAFGSGNVLYKSNDMADWGAAPVEGGYITDDGIGNIIDTYEQRLDKTIGKTDLSSPEVVKIGETWYLYISVMSGNTSMILRAPSTEGDANGPYEAFEPVLETGFKRSAADSVLQGYIQKSYNDNAPTLVSEWGKGTCYYYSNFLGLNYQWYTEELPRAYAPSIAQDNEGNYWMAYGYRDGGIWMQKIDPETGLVDYTWSGNNYAALGGWQTSPYQYVPEEDYNTSSVGEARLDPYFGQLIAHTTEGGDTDTLLSSVSRAGEEPELYFADGTAYLQVTYGGSNNSDGYNVRSYKDNNGYTAEGVTEKLWNFADMNGESGVDNADASMIGNENSVKRTGLKLMGDYGMPGTAEDTYYTSPGASSVSTGEDGLTFYNYQVKTNLDSNGNSTSDPAEMRSHILLHSAAGDPLVTPFEYTGNTDKNLYNTAKGAEYNVNDEIVGQYYVVASGNETSATKQGVGGVTLTAGGLVMGLISGTWEFETTPDGYVNGVHIYDQVNDVDYHGAFLMQTVEDSASLDSANDGTTTMTFTVTGNNQTVWGVWYDNYEPGGENNANAGLTMTPAIYTGGALDLNSRQIGQLGLKYGNYISILSFANIDYSPYLTIDEEYTITNVYDEDDVAGSDAGGDGTNGIAVMPLNTEEEIQAVINVVYRNRASDEEERSRGNGADTETSYQGSNQDSIDMLATALRAKRDEAQLANQKLYVLTGWLDSDFYGRNATMDDDKGDISLVVEYHDTRNNEYNERVYSHVYQQPVPANVSGASYDVNNLHWFHYDEYINTAFMRAEGSYSAESYLPDGQTVRNENMRNDTPDNPKYFAAVGTFGYYNDTLYSEEPNFGNNPLTFDFFHGNLVDIVDSSGDRASFNKPYRTTFTGTDITVSYERTFNSDNVSWGFNPGPRAEYYIDLSSESTSNIADYYSDGVYSIPLYYSNIYSNWEDWCGCDDSEYYRKTFNYYTDANNGRYNAGLYESDDYPISDSNPVGAEGGAVYNPDQSTYEFKAYFDDVEEMFDGTDANYNDGGSEMGTADNGDWIGGMSVPDKSYAANIWITASKGLLENKNMQVYGAEPQDDYNFYVRTRSENVANGPNRLIQDMEYGIYVSDKSFLRDYYEKVMEDKLAQNYTYYSWEEFRDATRLVADYLNNYMELADAYVDSAGNDDAYTTADYEAEKATLGKWLSDKGLTANEVLTNRQNLIDMLNAYSGQVQNVFCYLLTAAEEELFSYTTYQNFMDAYNRYNLAKEQMGSYTASSWKDFLMTANTNLGDTNISIDDLAKYLPGSNDSDTDPDKIYNPSADVDNDTLNHSWKIIYDDFFGDGASAREFFEEATRILDEATNILRRKADYSTLDAAMGNAAPYNDNRADMKGADQATDEEKTNAGMESYSDEAKAGIFSIDRSTVRALASTKGQTGYTVSGTDSAADGSYTVSSIAAFDKIVDHVYEVTGTGNEPAVYADKIADATAKSTNTPVAESSDKVNEDNYYSGLVRDDQKRYANTESDSDDVSKFSAVQQKIYDKADLVQEAVDQLTKLASDSEYQTFDYLIDVVSTIDWNAYNEVGRDLLWSTLKELLVEGGVYAVDQQLFINDLSNNEDASDFEQAVYDGDKLYYTGLNAGDVDEATTRLMTLLTELDTLKNEDGTPIYKKTYDVKFNIHYMNLDGTESHVETKTYDKLPYGEKSLTVSIPNFTSEDMSVRRWTVTTETDDGEMVTNLRTGASQYEYTSNTNATIDVYVTVGMAGSDMDSLIPVTVTSAVNGHNALSLWLSKDELKNYSVTVNEDTIVIKDTTDLNGLDFSMKAEQVPFYAFNCWAVSGKSVSNGTLADLLGDKDSITIAADYNITKEAVMITVNDKVYESTFNATQTINQSYQVGSNVLPGTFYAWLTVEDPDQFNSEDPDYKIASYNTSYTFDSAHVDQMYVQANIGKDAEGKNVYYVYNPNVDNGYIELTTKDMYPQTGGSPDDSIDEKDATSLYYRLDNHHRDSWSYISDFDTTSRTIMLYGHYTDAEGIEGAWKVEQKGLLYAYTAPGTAPDQLNDLLVEGTQGVQKLAASSSVNGVSEGEYSMYLNFPAGTDYSGWAIAMRSYVTYKCTIEEVVDGKTVPSTVYRTAYSDVEVIDLTNA